MGATVHTNTPIDSIQESDDGVVITSGDRSWTFENVIVSSGGCSRRLMPDYLKAATQTKRIFLSWFVARDAAEFSSERFPVFIRISGNRSMYGAPTVVGVMVKATLDGLQENSRIYCATGFSGAGFKMASGHGEIAAHEALGKRSFEGLDFLRYDQLTRQGTKGDSIDIADC
jgi:glycine/D-amino acid oxidase-like deaminating enzyme